MVEYRKGSHTVHDIKYHVVCRKEVITKAIGERLRKLIRQGCESMGITIVRGSIGKEHVHILLSCPTTVAPSKIVQCLKGRSSRLIQEEFPDLKKKYWGQHLWAVGYFCATVGAVTEETVHRESR